MGIASGDITWRTFGAGVVMVAALASYWGIYEHGRSVERAAWEKSWAERDKADSDARAQAEVAAREEEQRRAAAQQKAKDDAQKEQKTAVADAAGANAAGERLRDEARQFAAGVSCPGPDSSAIARGKAATGAAMVLSDLLARADARAGELAKAYDEARIAGVACEASYDALSIGSTRSGP